MVKLKKRYKEDVIDEEPWRQAPNKIIEEWNNTHDKKWYLSPVVTEECQKSVIDVYNEILEGWSKDKMHKMDPKTILEDVLSETYYEGIVSIDREHPTRYIVSIKYKKPIFIERENINIDSKDEIKEQFINAEWRIVL